MYQQFRVPTYFEQYLACLLSRYSLECGLKEASGRIRSTTTDVLIVQYFEQEHQKHQKLTPLISENLSVLHSYYPPSKVMQPSNAAKISKTLGNIQKNTN